MKTLSSWRQVEVTFSVLSAIPNAGQNVLERKPAGAKKSANRRMVEARIGSAAMLATVQWERSRPARCSSLIFSTHSS